MTASNNANSTVSLFVTLESHQDPRFVWVSWMECETELCSCQTHLTLTDFVGTHTVRMTREEARALQATEEAFMRNNPAIATMLYMATLEYLFSGIGGRFGRRPQAAYPPGTRR